MTAKEPMDDLINREYLVDHIHACMENDRLMKTATKEEILNMVANVPSAQRDAEFINWLLDEVWDEEMWELNYQAFPELLCRRLVKAGWLKVEDGKYVRLDFQKTVCPMCPDCPDNCPLEADIREESKDG